MKTMYLRKFLFLPLLFILFLVSCQDEVTEITNPDTEETLVANSALANLVRNTTANDGSTDNIIDFANCLEVELPVTVVIDGIEIIIDSEADFDVIEAIFDEFDDDIDDLEIIFPITIIFSDYTELVIENQDALEELIEECNDENEDDDDIECIDFQYPITISVYNTDFQVIDTITINSDDALYDFIENLEGGVLASINFPVTMILSDGSTEVVENNTELQAAIEAAEDSCDEDDDYDWDDDDIEDCDFNLLGLEEYLLECPTEIYLYNTNNQIENEYYVNFNQQGELIVTGEITVTEVGTWELSESDDGYVLTIGQLTTFGSINGDWLILGCDDDYEIIFSQETGSGLMTIEIEQECNNNPTDCNVDTVDDYLLTCMWVTANLNGSDDLVIFDLDFNENNELVISNSNTNETYSGYWNVSETASGEILLELANINGPIIQAISGYWLVVECREDRLQFINNANNDMVMERDCS